MEGTYDHNWTEWRTGWRARGCTACILFVTHAIRDPPNDQPIAAANMKQPPQVHQYNRCWSANYRIALPTKLAIGIHNQFFLRIIIIIRSCIHKQQTYLCIVRRDSIINLSRHQRSSKYVISASSAFLKSQKTSWLNCWSFSKHNNIFAKYAQSKKLDSSENLSPTKTDREASKLSSSSNRMPGCCWINSVGCEMQLQMDFDRR